MKKLVYSLMVLSLTAYGCGEANKDVNSCQVINNHDGTGSVVCTNGSSYLISGPYEGYDYCRSGFFGPQCQPCTCNTDHGICNDSTQGNGKCSKCYSGWTGENCEIQVSCLNGKTISDPNGSGKCSSCDDGWIGENCDIPASCKNGIAISGPTANGKCSECNSINWHGENCDECSANFSGNECSVFTKPDFGSITFDNDQYKTITIGTQVWLAENLRIIPGNGKEIGTDFFYPDGNSANLKDYGYLYTWSTAQTICPAGWHLPSHEEFEKLVDIAELAKISKNVFLSLIAKSSDWTDYSNQGGDDFGFGGQPAGYHSSGNYNKFGDYGYWWSSTTPDSSHAYYLHLGNDNASVYDDFKTLGFSVRCLKDSN